MAMDSSYRGAASFRPVDESRSIGEEDGDRDGSSGATGTG
jgi:hypothetical protein